MKINRNKFIVFVVAYGAMFIGNSFAQNVGVNTLTPIANLEVKGVGNTTATKTLRIENSSGVEILTMLDNGRLGLTKTDPAVRLDLRGSYPEPIVAIGTTTKTAPSVGGGAIRYMDGTKEIHYSDGIQWFRLQSSAIRPCLVARNDYVAGSYASGSTERIAGFVTVYDSHGAFNASNSVYTAPVDGLYRVSFTLSFNRSTSIPANTYLEGRWVSSNGREVKGVQTYPNYGWGQAGIVCTGTIQLQRGDTLWPEVWHNFGSEKSLRVYGYTTVSPGSDMGFNYLSIYSQ